MFMLGPTWFRHHYARYQQITTIALVTTWAVWFWSCCWLGVKYRQDGWVSGLKALTAFGPDTYPDGLCGNQHYRRELLMMDIMVSETCWALHKHNKVISGIYLDFILRLSLQNSWWAINRLGPLRPKAQESKTLPSNNAACVENTSYLDWTWPWELENWMALQTKMWGTQKKGKPLPFKKGKDNGKKRLSEVTYRLVFKA